MAKLGVKLQAALKEKSVLAKQRVKLTPGESIRIAREMLGLTQEDLARATGFNQSTLSALENNRETLGVDRARILARVLRVHPAILAFPDWDMRRRF